MMNEHTRTLFCIGCDHYQHLSNLRGAERDATAVFNLLTDPSVGSYNREDSTQLLSPTLAEVISAFERALEHKSIDTLTLYFAGHGGAVHGSYYLCFRDSSDAMMSTTALPLNHLFSIINEIRAAQCNIILDTCQAGGLVVDLSTLLKPDLIGKAHTPAISILATSASDQFSTETVEGGLGTLHLLKCLKGDLEVQSQRPYLDLVEVGRIVSDALASTGVDQTPTVWGLNLFGQSRFSRNPRYVEHGLPALPRLIPISVDSPAGLVIEQNAGPLWSAYLGNPEELTPYQLNALLSPIALELAHESAPQFIYGMASTFTSRARASENSFAAVEVVASCIALLLRFCGKGGIADKVVFDLANELCSEIEAASDELLAMLTESPLSLTRYGLPDLFYLPLRVSRILGWLSAAILIHRLLGTASPRLTTLAERVCRTIVGTYETALVAMSDEQTPYVLTFLKTARSMGLGEDGEKVLSHLFESFHYVKGNIASQSIKGERVPEYIRRRRAEDFGSEYDLLEHPAEMLAVLLMMAHSYDMVDEVDPYLEDLDHLPFNIFLPDDHRDFGNCLIENGKNHTFEIGHGIWKIADLIERWEAVCQPQLQADHSLKDAAVVIGAICASLVFPNRSPWLLMNDQK